MFYDVSHGGCEEDRGCWTHLEDLLHLDHPPDNLVVPRLELALVLTAAAATAPLLEDRGRVARATVGSGGSGVVARPTVNRIFITKGGVEPGRAAQVSVLLQAETVA